MVSSGVSMRVWLAAGFVLAAGFLAVTYSSAFSQYLWDEDDFVYVSMAVQADSPAYIFQRESHVQEFPRPFTHLYLWLIALISGTLIWPYIFFNLLLYAASSVLLFRIVHRLSGSLPAGLMAGTFYLLSPCATDSLYWVAGGATGFLSGFLLLLTVNLYMISLEKGGIRYRVLALLAALLAMGAKESAFSLPLLLTIVDVTGNGERKGWLKRLLPFYILGLVFAVNILLVQLSYQDDANLTRYGLSWMIPRNLLHYYIYPLVGAMPPDVGEYTLLKMLVYPVIWIMPVFFGSSRSRKLLLQGFLWTGVSSLPFLPWVMNFQGFVPRVCDIPSRYFNIPSMGAAMIAGGLVLMLRDRFRKKAASLAMAVLIILTAFAGITWTRENVRAMEFSSDTASCLAQLLRSSHDGTGALYVCYFGFYETRIESYNRMYFDGQLLQVDSFPEYAAEGAKLLCGPKTGPSLWTFQGGEWRLERRFPSCVDPERAQEFSTGNGAGGG